jgi:hypothetical protein
MKTMSMYVDILSSALDRWVDRLDDRDLVEYSLVCRAEMLKSGPHRGDSSYAVLSSEIAYDRSLIKLCELHHVQVTPTSFAYPKEERARLEHELADAGTDLAALARRQRNQ